VPVPLLPRSGRANRPRTGAEQVVGHWLEGDESPVCNTGGFVENLSVARHGVDDLTLVWDYSESPTLAKLVQLPYVESLRGRVLGGRGAFGKWESELGRHYATYSDRTQRLSVQLKLADEGELTSPDDLQGSVERFVAYTLAVRGLEPYSLAFVTRVDVSADLACDSLTGRKIIDGMAAVRLSGGRRVEAVGDPRSTVYFLPRRGRAKLARTYDRNLLTGEGEPYGLIRLEAQWKFRYGQLPIAALTPGALANLWLMRFGKDEVNATVERLPREQQAIALGQRVSAGEMKAGQAARMHLLVDLDRLGVARTALGDRIYSAWRREARLLGLAKSDVGDVPLDVELAALIGPAREVWDGYLLPYLQPPADREP